LFALCSSFLKKREIRFAVSYLVCTLAVLFIPRFSCRFSSHSFPSAYSIYVDRLIEWIFMLLLVALWLLLTFLLPVPGCPTGYIGPGGASLGPALANCTGFSCSCFALFFVFSECYLKLTGGAARYIDLLVFGEKHIYLYPNAQQV
jgi:heparan-alpha-glucosaminide N-acetyltransferase